MIIDTISDPDLNEADAQADEYKRRFDDVASTTTISSKYRTKLWDSNRKWKRTLEDLRDILQTHPSFANKIRLNSFSNEITFDDKPLEETDLIHIRLIISEQCKVSFSKNDIQDMVGLIAKDYSFHPVREYLSSIEWDGKDRIGELLSYIHPILQEPEQEGFHKLQLRCFLISCVARIFQPGETVQAMLVLKGNQNVGKSTFFKTLGKKWFSDQQIEIGSKDALQTMQGVWILEMAEFYGISKKESNLVKGFLTRDKDKYRPSYARLDIICPRQTVFCGTTNDDDFLSDPTGSRRFMIIESEAIDNDKVAAIVDQLWAQAKHHYDKGIKWYLTKEQSAKNEEYNQPYNQEEAWLSEVEKLTEGLNEVSIGDILSSIKPVANQKRADAKAVANCLKQLGFERARTKTKKYWIRRGAK